MYSTPGPEILETDADRPDRILDLGEFRGN